MLVTVLCTREKEVNESLPLGVHRHGRVGQIEVNVSLQYSDMCLDGDVHQA